MSLPQDDPAQPQDELQFDHVEQDDSQPQDPTCSACKQPIIDAYYEINSGTICMRCRDTVLQSLTGGSRWGRFVRATIFGSIAGLIGAVIWGGIRMLTGYEIGLIAVLVGLIVGGAVRAGSRNRGGWAYQLLAVFLTYSSVAASLVPTMMFALNEQFVSELANEEAPATTQPAVAQGSSTDLSVATTQPAGEENEEASFENLSTGEKFGALGMAVIFTFILSAVLPIFSGDILWILIIGFALWEAWKLNKAPKIIINGPFQLSPPFTRGGIASEHTFDDR